MSTPRQEDTERDAWLGEALRHAPDAQAAPPSALSDAILRQARAATPAAGAPAKAPARNPWAAAWGWLARPPVAAGLASVMVATLIGMVWWDQPMDSTIVRPPALDATPAIDATPPPTVAVPPPVATAPQPPAFGEIVEGAAKPGRESAAQRKLDAPKRTPRRAEAEPAARTAADADAAAPAPAAPPPAAAPVAAPVLALRARESAAPATAQSKSEAVRDESRALTPSDTLARSAAVKAAAPPAQLGNDFTGARAGARPVAFGTLLASVAAQPERWGWERTGAVQPMTPALQRWLARVDAATSTARWRAAADAASSGEANVLRLYRDGTLAATLRLDDESVGLVPGPRAALPPAALAALKQALDDATR